MKQATVEPKKDELNIAVLRSPTKAALQNALAKPPVPTLSMAETFTLS